MKMKGGETEGEDRVRYKVCEMEMSCQRYGVRAAGYSTGTNVECPTGYSRPDAWVQPPKS